MSLWHIAWCYLWNRKLTTGLTILSVGLSVGLISAVLTLRQEAQRRFEEEGQAFDLVVGAKGSPLTLVLSSVYFMQTPAGNIPVEELHRLRDDTEFVQAAFPIGLGDSYGGFRIVGTDRALMDHSWESPSTGEKRYPFALAEGAYFEKPFEAVLGAEVARQTRLALGDDFVSLHGFSESAALVDDHDHSQHPYVVTGILKPSASPFDRAIFCNMESVYEAHGVHHHDGEEEEHHEHEEVSADSMVTSVLVQLHSPADRFTYRDIVNRSSTAMAVIPILEIAKFFNQFLATAKLVLLSVGYLVVVVSALSILIGLYMAILQRRRDLAIMRALGASASEIVGAVLIEALLVTLLGIACGWCIGNAVTWAIGLYLAREYGLVISAFGISPEEINAFATVALVGFFAGILPAWQAYNRDIAHDLADR